MSWINTCRQSATIALFLGTISCLGSTASAQVVTANSYTHPVITEGRVDAKFGKRTDPVRQKTNWHAGTDLTAALNTPIYTPTGGTVVYAGTRAGYGKMVDVAIADGWTIRFAHLNVIDVTTGQTLSSGETLGLMGKSGRTNEPHLHLEFRKDGKQYDPERVDGLTLIKASN